MSIRKLSLFAKDDDKMSPFLSDDDKMSMTGSVTGDEEEGGVKVGAAGGAPAAAATRNELSTIRGVFLPVMFSIFGVILYTRWGWIVGSVGWLGVFAILVAGELVTILTTMSISALSTNGKIRGGGSYFLISRSLGPEFGGSLGMIFYLANIFNNAQYLAVLAQTIIAVSPIPDTYLITLALRSGILLICVLICYAGAETYAKTLSAVTVVFAVSIAVGLISFLVPSTDHNHVLPLPALNSTTNIEDSPSLFWGLKKDLVMQNAFANYDFSNCPENAPVGSSTDFWGVFAVAFNGMTGINAGANLSGDLKDPAKSIPVGTFAGIFFSIGTYIFATFAMAGTTTRVGLQCNYQVMQQVCVWPPLVWVGILISMFIATLSSITGAARILQALARDALFPGMSRFAKGSVKGDEPRNGVLLSYIITQGLVFVPSLNLVATITTFFFLLSYTVTNLACFLHKISGAPNFRPTFKYFTWHTALVGSVWSAVLMFLINPLYAFVSLFIFAVLFIAVHYRRPAVTDWGDVTQALIFHQVRKYLLQLDVRKDHVKYWRPSLLLLVKNPSSSYNLMMFCDNMKKGGLYILGSVFIGDLESQGEEVKQSQKFYLDLIAEEKIKAFHEVALGPTLRAGIQSLLLTAGMGSMKPHTVVLGFPEVTYRDSQTGGGPAASEHFNRRGSQGNSATRPPPPEVRRSWHQRWEQQEEIRQMELFESSAADTNLSVLNNSTHSASTGGGGGGGHPHHHSVSTRAEIGAEKPFDEKDKTDWDPVAFVKILLDCAYFRKNVLIARNFHLMDRQVIRAHSRTSRKMTIDLWLLRWWLVDGRWGETSNTVSLMLQLGWITSRSPFWKKLVTLRVLTVAEDAEEIPKLQKRLDELLLQFRIDATATVFVMTEKKHNEPLAWREKFDVLHNVIIGQCGSTACLFATVPPAPSDLNVAGEYLSQLDRLSRDLPPCMLVQAAESSVISTET